MGAPDLQLLLASCPQLRMLAMPRTAGGIELAALCSASLTLTELDLGDCSADVTSVDDRSLTQLPVMPSLRTVSLMRCVAVSDAGVAQLGATKLPRLAHLDLSSTRVTGSSGFAGLAPMESIVLHNCRALGAAGLAAVCRAHAGSLRSLTLCGTAVQPYGSSLALLAPAVGLARLDLGPSWEVDGVGLAALACLPALADLRLGNFNLRPQRPGQPPALTPPPATPAPAAAAWPPPLTPLSGPAPGGAVGPLPADLSRCLPSLARLSLGGMFAQHGLARLLPRLTRLRRLELSGIGTARDDVLGLLLAGAPPPGLGGTGGAGSAGPDGTSASSLSLQELKLVSGGPDLTAAGLLRLAALPGLQRLQLIACPCATEDTVRQLVDAVRAAIGRRLRVDVSAKKPPLAAAATAAVLAAGGGGAEAAAGGGVRWGGCGAEGALPSSSLSSSASVSATAVPCRA
ncbi:hypothetical protein GPECTOR_6g525 [Gonium pectorale]|uniref:Uncharacterized protein n=1 Tax=Gonium pectorale TaxID=33097 RepID=A0A150GV91_GONPE|nr:hypothetical protein GPECTOR_6g525 [Gonium pectorale]|eukprot:KXZ53608.1 hypothetical protein GPECTOR_6g525 [Gonium pectorale]